MEKLTLVWEKDKGYKLIIDDIAFHNCVTEFEISGTGIKAPDMIIKLFGSRPLIHRKE